jgi:hypothetical protein
MYWWARLWSVNRVLPNGRSVVVFFLSHRAYQRLPGSLVLPPRPGLGLGVFAAFVLHECVTLP